MALSRRAFLGQSSMALAASAAGLARVRAQAQPAAPPPPATKFTELRRGAGYFTGQGGTIGYVITTDNTVVIDSQYPATARICLDGLKSRASHPIDFLINTHHHVDHTAGNPVFRPAVARIIAQRGEPALQRHASDEAGTLNDQVFPDVVFTTDWKMILPQETISAHFYGPGHSGADITVHFEDAGVVHMGDLVWNRFHPFVDRAAGASIVNWQKTLDRAAGQHPGDTIYIFGHGKPEAGVTGARADLLRFRDYFTAVLDYVQRGIQVGHSKAEVTALESLRTFEDYVAPSKTITLAHVLGAAYEELRIKN
jgi:glyoxylase-like metal-dependent hydrolase (beta-lactamase superfamily II)